MYGILTLYTFYVYTFYVSACSWMVFSDSFSFCLQIKNMHNRLSRDPKLTLGVSECVCVCVPRTGGLFSVYSCVTVTAGMGSDTPSDPGCYFYHDTMTTVEINAHLNANKLSTSKFSSVYISAVFQLLWKRSNQTAVFILPPDPCVDAISFSFNVPPLSRQDGYPVVLVIFSVCRAVLPSGVDVIAPWLSSWFRKKGFQVASLSYSDTGMWVALIWAVNRSWSASSAIILVPEPMIRKNLDPDR